MNKFQLWRKRKELEEVRDLLGSLEATVERDEAEMRSAGDLEDLRRLEDMREQLERRAEVLTSYAPRGER